MYETWYMRYTFQRETFIIYSECSIWVLEDYKVFDFLWETLIRAGPRFGQLLYILE